MAEMYQRPEVRVRVYMALDEAEARALDALVGYGDDAFIKHFYEKLGQHYLRPHERGLRSLFKSARGFLPGILSRSDRARAAFGGPHHNDARQQRQVEQLREAGYG